MKFHLQIDGGKEPGLLIQGTRADIQKFLEQNLAAIKTWPGPVEANPKEATSSMVSAEELMQVTGNGCEWLGFKILTAEQIDSLQRKALRSTSSELLISLTIVGGILATLYFAAIGIASYFK